MLLKVFFLFFLSLISAAPLDKNVITGEPPVTHVVTFVVEQGSEPIGNMTLGLFGSVAPKTVENFWQLAGMNNGYGYHRNIFHRVIKEFMIQGGDFENQDGTGGHSIYGRHRGALPDESFHLKHDRPGRLAMANSGRNTAGSQFFITSGPAEWLDDKHVVFGQLIEGMDTFKQIEAVPTAHDDKPLADIVISHISLEKREFLEKRGINGTVSYETDSNNAPGDSNDDESGNDDNKSGSKHDYGLIALVALVFIVGFVLFKYGSTIKSKFAYRRLL